MKIGIFIELYRPYVSGVVVSVDMLIDELAKRGHQVVLFTPEVPGYEDEAQFPVIRLPSFSFFGKRFAKPFLTKKTKKEVENLNLDLIHIQGPYATGILGVKLGRKLGLPVIMTYHAHVLFYLKTWAKTWNLPFNLLARIITLFIIRWVSKRCQLIITPSHFIESVLRSYGIKNRIEVLPTGVQLPSLAPRLLLSRAQLGLPEEAKVLLYVGRISKEKNLKMLLLSFEKVLKKRKDVVLAFLGDGPQMAELKKIVRRKKVEESKLKDWVFFLGAMPHEKVWSFLKVSDIFVFPSLSETQGLSVAEAMAAGLPVVVVGEGGAPEFVDNKENGLVVRNNPEEFASAILSVLEGPGFTSYLGRNAQEKINQLEPEIIYQKMESLYLQFTKELSPAIK